MDGAIDDEGRGSGSGGLSTRGGQQLKYFCSHYSNIFATIKRRLEQSALHEKENMRGAHVVHPLGVVPIISSELCE